MIMEWRIFSVCINRDFVFFAMNISSWDVNN